MTRGGRRTGAGAPRNNLNALRNGEYSQQLRTALEGNKADWKRFLRRLDAKERARANMVAALIWGRQVSSGNNTG